MTARRVLSNLAGLTFEEESSFGADPASSPTAIRASNISFQPSIEMLPAGYQKPEDMRGPDPYIVSFEGGTLSFDVPLRGGEGSEAPVISLTKRMGASLSSITAGVGLIDSGTSTTFVVTDAEASAAGFAVGQVVLHKPASGTYSFRGIERIESGGGSTTVTVNGAFVTTPQSGDSWGNTDTVTPQSGNPDKTFSFTLYQGQGTTNRHKWVLSGCSGTWSLTTTEAGAFPVLSFEFQVDNWASSEDNTTLADDTLSAALPLIGDTFYIDSVAVDTRSIGFNPGLEMTPEQATSGSNGRANWIFTNSVPKLEIAPLHDIDYISDWAGATTFDALFNANRTSTRGWAVWVPKAQIVAHNNEDSDGVLRAAMDIEGVDPGKNADSTNLPLWAFCVAR